MCVFQENLIFFSRTVLSTIMTFVVNQNNATQKNFLIIDNFAKLIYSLLGRSQIIYGHHIPRE